MPITLNGTTGVVTPGATVGSITGVLKATSGVVAQAVAGSDYGQLTLATAQSATGTAVDFTSIPSWAKRITVMLNGVSTNGSSSYLIQLGTSGGIENSGYLGAASTVTTAVATTANSTGLMFVRNPGSNEAYSGMSIISFLSSNTC